MQLKCFSDHLGMAGFVVVVSKISKLEACELMIDNKVVWRCNITSLNPGK